MPRLVNEKGVKQGREMVNFGVIGLGMMVRAMARILLRAGHCVTVWNRTRSSLYL